TTHSEENHKKKSSEESGENSTTSESIKANHNSGFHIPGSLWPLVRYNRVDGLFAGLKYSKDTWNGLGFTIRGGYSTAAKIGSYGAKVQYDKSFGRFKLEANAGYQVHNATQYHSQ